MANWFIVEGQQAGDKYTVISMRLAQQRLRLGDRLRQRRRHAVPLEDRGPYHQPGRPGQAVPGRVIELVVIDKVRLRRFHGNDRAVGRDHQVSLSVKTVDRRPYLGGRPAGHKRDHLRRRHHRDRAALCPLDGQASLVDVT